MSTEKALVELPSSETALEVYSKVGGLDPYIEKVKELYDGVVYDMGTKEGRAECASDAHKIAKFKVAIENLGKSVSADLKLLPKKVDAERSRANAILEAFQKQVRAPYTEYEEAEKNRVSSLEYRIDCIYNKDDGVQEMTADGIAGRIAEVEAIVIGPDFQEFEPEARSKKSDVLERLNKALVVRKKTEADQAELALLREQAAAQAKKDSDARIAAEAADKVRKEAEEKAADEKRASDKREADLQAAAAKAKQDLEDAHARAEKIRLDGIAKAAQDVLDERKRVADLEEAGRLAAEVREKDELHKKSINNAAVTALMAGGLTQGMAKAAIILIARRKVPAVSITY